MRFFVWLYALFLRQNFSVAEQAFVAVGIDLTVAHMAGRQRCGRAFGYFHARFAGDVHITQAFFSGVIGM